MARLRVLLTGFGPFPGAPDNPSAWLAETLASQASLASDCAIEERVLPTEWAAVAALAPRLYEALQPDVMIHFGLSQRAKGFRIERSAHNRSLPRADAISALPPTGAIDAEGPDRLDTALSAAKIAAHLRGKGLKANASRSCGRYLCNFLYYRSLAWAARQQSSRLVVFVHIPPTDLEGGPVREAELLHAGKETLRYVLAVAEAAGRAKPLTSSIEPEIGAAPSMADAAR
jgi:pyroglutamyl-peptidase